MRFVTLNLDLQDAAALNRAVEASLAGCDCRKEGHGARCELCASLEPIHQDLTRLLTRPRLRLPAPLALNGDDGMGKNAASSGAQLRLLPPMTADL